MSRVFRSSASLVGSLALALILAPACGGDDGLGNGDGAAQQDLSASTDMTGSSHDMSMKPAVDLRGADFAGISCGSETCSGSSVCCIVPDIQNQTATSMCVAAGACGDGGVPAACDGPEDCSGGTPNCCVELAFGGGSMSAAGGAMCTSSCPASAAQSNGGGMLETKLCHGPSDCANYSGMAPIIGTAPFDKCCGYPGVTFQFCAPSLITLVSNSFTCN